MDKVCFSKKKPVENIKYFSPHLFELVMKGLKGKWIPSFIISVWMAKVLDRLTDFEKGKEEIGIWELQLRRRKKSYWSRCHTLMWCNFIRPGFSCKRIYSIEHTLLKALVMWKMLSKAENPFITKSRKSGIECTQHDNLIA